MDSSRRWLILGVGLLGLVAGCAAQYGLAYLIPAMRTEGMSLEAASVLVSAPITGVVVTLIAWGAAADRWGERVVLVSGLALAGAAELGAAAISAPLPRWLLLFVVGAASAAIHAASGRLILGWFGVHERGLAMGIRQAGLPLGLAVAAVALPPLAGHGIAPALVALGASCLVTAGLIAMVVQDPERPPAAVSGGGRSPYREPFLWRIHLSSALLVVPQITIAVYAFDYLVNALGWSIAGAGLLLAISQLAGAGSRLVAGWWSDRAGSRLEPMRAVALAIGLVLVLVAGLALAQVALVVAALALAAVLTVTPNGLAFTAVAERAGSRWAGRALGIQNTFQTLAGALVPVPVALVVSAGGGHVQGYAIAFAAVTAFPFLAAAVIPVAAEAPVG